MPENPDRRYKSPAFILSDGHVLVRNVSKFKLPDR